jgi:transcriptional regulator with XRE-family HTH domain
MNAPSKTGRRPTAEPSTAIIADRVRQLRKSRGLSQTDLAEALNRAGVPWTRTIVVNLETHASESRGNAAGRDAVTVGELLALASVLKVHPAALVPELDPTVDGDLVARFSLLPDAEQSHVRQLIELLLGRALIE